MKEWYVFNEKKKKKKDGNPIVLNHFSDFYILILIKER